jgi:hypothetical protein
MVWVKLVDMRNLVRIDSVIFFSSKFLLSAGDLGEDP